jgi:cation:H+ antiporter
MFATGLLGLFLGGEFLVRGAVGIARRLSVPPLVIGLTVVGFGTSMPELLVSIQAALAGAPALAIGNVVGSNIANILLILGLTAVILPVPIRFADTKPDIAVVIGSSLVLWLLLLGETIRIWQGFCLFAGLIAYLYVSIRPGRKAPEPDLPQQDGHFGKNAALALGGLVLLLIGARLLVDSASEIARTFGVSDAVIGLSIVAIGTSLPELATSALAALRGHSEIAVGNILGSCVFNILGILGLTAVVAPIPVDPRFAHVDMWIALAAALAMLWFAAGPGRVSRASGAVLLAGYAAYMALLA